MRAGPSALIRISMACACWLGRRNNQIEAHIEPAFVGAFVRVFHGAWYGCKRCRRGIPGAGPWGARTRPPSRLSMRLY